MLYFTFSKMKMIFKLLVRLCDIATPNTVRVYDGFIIHDPLFIHANKLSDYLIIRNCQYTKLNKRPVLAETHTKSFATKKLEKFSDGLEEIIKYNEIWNTAVKENELPLRREKFNEFIKLLGKLNEDEAFSFLAISKIDYKYFRMVRENKDKIFEMAVLLKCCPNEAFKAILKHPFLLRSKITTLQQKIDVITGSGIDMVDLRRDLWVLSYTIGKLQARIEKVKTLNLTLKCWMLRCNEATLNRSWDYREKNKAAMLPFTNTKEYLCNRLDMNDSQLISFSNRHPAVLKVNTAKLSGVLDFLLSEGFSVAQIYSTPRILCHSIATITKRLRLLREKDCEPHTLSLLCISAKAFEIYLQKLEKMNHTER